jgi:hypothetical protein
MKIRESLQNQEIKSKRGFPGFKMSFWCSCFLSYPLESCFVFWGFFYMPECSLQGEYKKNFIPKRNHIWDKNMYENLIPAKKIQMRPCILKEASGRYKSHRFSTLDRYFFSRTALLSRTKSQTQASFTHTLGNTHWVKFPEPLVSLLNYWFSYTARALQIMTCHQK